jgi:hypothetical protein
MDAPREWGKLWESWMLEREVDGERMQTDQLLLERLDGDRWRIVQIEWPHRGGQRREYVFADEPAARAVLTDLYDEGTALGGHWHISRFGHHPYQPSTMDGRPQW